MPSSSDNFFWAYRASTIYGLAINIPTESSTTNIHVCEMNGLTFVQIEVSNRHMCVLLKGISLSLNIKDKDKDKDMCITIRQVTFYK